ncbi:hypothetical protein TB1_024887 [Malus domestica]
MIGWRRPIFENDMRFGALRVVVCEYGGLGGRRIGWAIGGCRWFRMGELGLWKIGKSYRKRNEKRREESKEWQRRLRWREQPRKEWD